MHDRKLTECVDASGPGSPKSPLAETARVEQTPMLHETVSGGASIPDAGPQPPLPSAREPAAGNPELAHAGEPEHSTGEGEGQTPDLQGLAPIAPPVLDAPGPAVSPGPVGTEADDRPTPPDIAPATEERATVAVYPGLTTGDHFESASKPIEPGPDHRPEQYVPQPEPDVHAWEAAVQSSPEHGWSGRSSGAESQSADVSADVSAGPNAQSPRATAILATAVRYAVVAFCGWLAVMVLLIAMFRFVNPPGSALMLIRAAQGVEIDQRWVPLEEISPNLIRAVIVSEDGRFCSHWGIDPREVLDAIRDANGGTPRGASTMTMQLAKNLFLWPQQSYIRKALEVPLTLAIDAAWPKSRIAEIYLNVVEWGPGIFGAEAAARRHFDTSAEKLTKRQSALLAVTLPNPRARKPAAPSRMHNRMASTIVARMRSMSDADDCVTEVR